MAERIRPKQTERRVVLVQCGEIQRILVNVIHGIVVAQTEGQRVFVLDFEIFLGSQHVRAHVIVRWRRHKAGFVVIEGADRRFVLTVSRHIAVVAEILPHERTLVEFAGAAWLARVVGQCAVVAHQDCH